MKGAPHFILPFNDRMLLNKKTVMIVEFFYARFSYSSIQCLNLYFIYIGISKEF